MLEPLEIAPKIYFIDADGKFLDQHFIIIDFIAGETLGELNEKNIILLARVLKKLHTSITFARSGNDFPPTNELPYICGIFHEFADGEDKQIEKYKDLSGVDEVRVVFNRVKLKLGEWFEQKTIRLSTSCFK